MNENQKFIYDQLIGKGIEAGTPEEFANGITSKEGAQWAYDQLSNDVDLGDFNAFYSAISKLPDSEKQYVAPALGGKQPEQAPQENILPDYKAMDAARTMTPAETNQVLNQGVPGVTRIGDTNISHLQTDMLMNEKFGGGYKDTSAGRTEEITPVGEMEAGVELVGAPFNPDEEEPYKKERPDGFFSYIGDNINAVNTGASQAVAGLMGYGEEFYRNLEKVGIPGVSDLFGTYADAWGGVKEYFKRDAAASMARTSNYEGKDFTDLWKEGRYADSIAKLYTDATQSIPLSVASMGAVAAGRPDVSFSLMYASQAGNTMDELRDNTDMTDTQKQVNAHLIGAAEALSELFGDKVMVGWLGDVFKKGGERLLKSKIASGVRPMIHNLLKSNSLLIPPAIEGTEEFVNSLAQNVINYTTGKTNVYKPLEGTLEAFIQGFAGGSQFAAVGAGKMAYDQVVEYVKGFEAKTNFNHSRKEYERLMSENGYAPADIQEIETQLIAATPEEAQKMIGQLVQNMDGAVIELENGNYGLHEAFTQPLVDLYTSGKQLEHRSKKLQTKVQEFNQRAEQYVTDNLNPDMNALVFAEFQGQPVRVVSGVVQIKDKEIDTEVSTPEIYIETQEGIRIIPPQLLDARKGLRITPAQQAVQEIAQQAAEPVVAQHENEEVRPYNEGEIVRAEIAGSPVLGTIVGKTEQGYTIRDAQGVMIQIQPRQIINEDNLEGVDNESVVEYRDQSGAIRTGVVTDIYSERVQGYAYIDDQRIPFKDILGLKTDEVIAGQPQNAGSAPVTNNNLSELPPPPANLLNDGNGNITEISPAGATQDAEQAAQAPYPVTKTGELDFDNFTPEQLFSYTAQEFGEQAAIEDVKASIAGLEAQLSKKKKAFEKMGMKDRVKARSEISKMEAEIAAFSNLIPTAPVETAPPAVESAPATQLSTPPAQQSAPAPEVSAPVENTPSAKKRRAVKDGAKKNTTGRPQWLVNKVRRSGEPKNLRELIMHKLIFGAKLRWNDIVSENKAILTRGLGGEYRYAEAERKPRANSMMGYVSESGITPEQLAHQIWEANALEDGQFEDIPLTGYDTQQILDEILDVANTYPTVSGMARDLEKWAEKIEQDEKSYFDEIMEMEQEDGLPMAEEFEIFVDNIPQEAIDNSLRAANFTPEELNELFEFLNNVYENDEQGGSRGTKEDAEASGNNESGVKSQEGRNATSEGTTNQRGDSGSSPADQRAEQGAGLTDEINSQSPELNPTEAQKEAGNYKKAHIKLQGMDITIENPKNSVRSGVDENGKAWSNTLQNHYGYFTRTTGKDGDQIDTFIGERPESNMVFVVDQNNPETGRFDESKVMLGFNSAEEAQAAYMSNYEADWKGFGSITPVSIEDFKKWLYDGARQRKPFSEYRDTPEAVKPIEADTKGIEGKKKPEPTTVRELADYDAGEQKGYLSGMFFSGLEKGSKFKVARKDYEVTQYSKPKKVEFVGKKGNQITYDEITIRIKELATGKTITTKLITWPNGNSQFTGVESNQNHEQLSRDIEGDVNTDLINEYNRFHEKSDSFKIIQKQLDKLKSQQGDVKPEVKPKRPIESVEPQSPIDNLNAILSGEKVVEAPTLEDQLKAAEQKLSTVKKDRDKKYRRYLDLKERLDEIGSRDQVDVEGNVGNGMLAFEELDKEAKEKVNAARKEYEPLNEQVKELESKIEKLQGRIKDQKMNQQEMNFEEPVETEIKEQPKRFEEGKKLSKEEKAEVLKSMKDSYKEKNRPRTFETDISGRERFMWLGNSTDYMEKSDITGQSIRWYITMPDGKIAHPTELYPDLTAEDIKRTEERDEYWIKQAENNYKDGVRKLSPQKTEIIENLKKAIESGITFDYKFAYDSDDVRQRNPNTILRRSSFIPGDPKQGAMTVKEYMKIQGVDIPDINTFDWERYFNENNNEQNNLPTESRSGSVTGNLENQNPSDIEDVEPVKPEIKPVNELGTGSKVYFDKNGIRVNEYSKGGYILNVTAKGESMPMANVEFDDKDEAVLIAEKLNSLYPNGIPGALLVDKVIDGLRNKNTQSEKAEQNEYKYELRLRPFDIGTYPTDGFVRFEQTPGSRFGHIVMNRELPLAEWNKWELTPTTSIENLKGKEFLDKDGYYSRIEVKYFDNGVDVTLYNQQGEAVVQDMWMPYLDVFKNIESGHWRLRGPESNTIKEETNNIDLQQKPPVERSNYGNTNKIVSNDRYEELKRRMKGKLGNLNAGFDPELLAIGAEMAAYHIEAGARKFADFAKRMIEDLGDSIRPYLKSFYQGARYMPGMETLSAQMDDPNSVNNFDINNLKIQQDVLDRPDSSKSDSQNTNDVQPDEIIIPNDGRGGQQQGSTNESRTPRTRNKRNSGKSGSGLFSDLFGEESDNGISQQDGTNKPQSNDAGNQQPTGDVVDSTEGLSDLDSERPNTDTQDNQSNGEQAETFAERTRKRIEQQKRAESIKNKSMDINNIRETLPMLLPEQQDDVLKAETRFFSKDHNTGPLAYGKGMLFTNGTGTGKTYTGLGIIKRFTKEGKNNILIVVPSQEKVSDWAKDGKNLLLDITPLEDTSTSGEGVNVTTYANFVNNEELQKRDFDLVVFDESHRIMENKDGEYSGTTSKFRSLANVTESYALNRIESVTPEYIEIRQLEKSIRDEETALGGSLDQPMEQYITRRSELDDRIKKREELQKNYNNNILPKLKDRAKNAHQNTKVVLLSATPFKGHKNLRYANHVLFDWGTEITHQQASRVMSRVDAESRYFLDNFGAAYEWKNHQLQAKKNSNAEAIAMQEVQYAENLINMGVMSGRTIESDMDYARHFPVVTLENAEMFNDALNDIYSGAFQQLRQPAYSVFSDYNYTTKLFESLKASMYIPRIKQHLEMGRKVVLFHRRQQANVTPPFETIIRLTEEAISANEKTLESMKQNGWSENEIQEQADKILQMKIQKSGFLNEYYELFKFEKILNYAPAVQQIQEAFGDQVMFFNGSVSKQEKSRAVKEFNNDNSNVKIIMIQEEAGKEGISLHDTTGKHQRVLANLSLPISSTTALQIEGRIYRIGNESNAIFEYPLIGLDQEIRDFGSKINKKLSTTENLAIGDQSRDLLRSFSDGVLFNTSTDAPNSEQGIGGREYDRRQQEAMSEFRKAILVYHGNQKQRGSRDSREGVDYYATPEPVGQKMIEWLGLRPGEIAMEPSAGHGAIAMWIPDRANSLVIEPSFKLFSKLNARAGGGNRRMINDTFENLDIINKVDGVAMNPPFGTAGKTAMDHVEKAFKHLHDGGRIVALIPRGKMDERLDKFLYGENEKGKLLNPNAHLVGEILLPSITFDQAGTKVSTRLVVIDKTDNPVESVRHDLTFAETIEELFDAIENINMPERPEKIEPETVADNSFTEQWEQKNSRTGEAMYMVKFRGLVDNDTFSKARGIASKNNGRYSSFKSKADNVRAGFAFSTKEDADKFNSDVASLNKEDAAFKIVGENLPATININGVERPTTNSEGKPIHSTEEGIRNFYEWFSNSKVVDEQGRPLVVYHGAYENFDVFKKSELGKYTNAESAKQGFFFTDKNDLASDFAYDSARSFGKYSEKQILAQIQKADIEKINEFVTRKIKGEYDFSIYNSINEYLEDNRKIKSIEPSESEYRDAINNLAAEYLYNGISDSDTSNEYKRIFDELGISIGYVQEVELKIENPLVVNKAIDFEDGDGLTHYIEKAKKDGNDGVIFNNVREVILEGSKMTKQFVVFEPTQIKSATGNSGEFSGNTDDMLFKMSPYYSPTERALETLKQEKGTPDQMKAMLLKNGAKEAEFEWMGWDEFVSDKKTISKVDIQQWIDENKIEIQEVEKGSVKPMATMANISEVKFSQYGSGSYLVSYRMGEDEGVVIIGTYEAGNEQEAKEKALERINNSESDYVSQATKFSQYVLPGGENYKELLLTMPATHYMYDINKVKIEETNTFWMFYDKDGELITGYAKDHNPTKEDAINTFKSNFKIDNKDVFQSSHFDEPNILAHVRFNERTVNGERVLFIEEIQSDWAQSGKKSGFKNTEDNDNVKSARKSYEEAKAREDEVNNKLINVISEAQKMGLPVGASNSEWNKFTYGLFKTSEVYRIENKMQEVKNNKDWNEYQSMLDEITSKQNELGKQRLELIRERDYIESLSNDRKEKLDREIRNQEFNSVPDMPFKKTDQWVNLTLRRMMQYAAENGFDRVAWTNGTQQAERYDLSKQIESVEYFDTSGRLIAYNKEGNSVINEAGIEQNKVEDYIGKEATKKLFENITEERNGGRKYELKGEQLSVGGEGMKAFYDKIVPTQAGKLVKPFGVKVESIDIKTLDTSNTKVETTEKGNYRLVDDKGNTLSSMTKETGDGFSKADLHSELVYLAKRYPTMNATAMVQSIPVNQEMREVLAAGIPLFKMSAQTGKGMSLEDAQWLSDTLTGVFNVEGTEGKTPTVVVASTKDLIEKLPGYAKQLTAYQVSGINTGDKVYINMEHVKSKEQFVKTWLHEHIHQITIDNYTENGIERFYNSLPAEVKGVLRSGYSGKSNLIKGLEIIAHYTEVLLDSVGLENLMNGNFDLSLVPESVRPILGEHLEIITYGNYQNNRENQLNDSRNDRGTTKGLQTTTARAGYQRDGSIRNTRRGNEDRAAFRITDDVSPLRDVVDAKLRKAVVKIGNRQLGEGFRFKVQENWQDSHIAVKHFLDVLRTNGVVIEDFNDYYLQVTQVPGRTDAQVDHYERMFHKPLMEAIGALQEEGMSYRDVENYAIMKHGIERNEYMRNQEAKIYAEKKVKKPTLKEQELDIDGSIMDEYRAALQDAYDSKLISLSDKDYSGITAVKEEVEMTAEEYVAYVEGRVTEQSINNFWTAVNNATNNSLEQAFKAGSISKATYEDLKSRYQFYIPLRGFDQEIAEDRYDYAPDMGTYYSLPMISAKGRRSRSETPFAYIWQMNQSAITFANRNILNQSIKRLSAKDTKGLLTAKKAWYMLTGEIDGVKQWELREPEYSPDWKQYQKNIETFEEEMQELEEKGFASQRGGKLNLGLFTKPKQATQHTVHVMQNGVEYVIYFNADPAVSRAINGSNRTIANPGRVETFVRNASRTMAANFTTRNPVFVLSNFSRDFLYAASTLPAKESAAYAAKFVKNIPLVAASLKRAIKGKPDMTNPIDQLAVEYILNGGKTGYSSIVELQKTQKRIERDLRRHGKSSKAEALLKGIQAANEFAENITRLSAYVTSRHEGRSIIQSISDAKELTVNFNRNGAGGYGAAFIKSYWLFVNAGIQAMANFYSIAKNHPGKTAAVIATYMAWGVIQPLLISLLGDDDDLEEYFKMSDWERQNNLIFPTGAGFIKIPLPHELRLFHAMGDNIAQTIFGYKDAGETIADTAMSFADLIPISPAGAIDASWVEMLPDAIKPLAQIHFTNTNFMGGRIVDENKTRSEVMPGYRMARTNKKGEVLSPSFVVGMTKFLDHITGGDGTQKGLVSMNPDEVNHLLRGYFGGLYTMAVQFGGIAYSGYEWSKGGDFKVKFKDTPLKAFYTSTDELNEKNSGLNKNFYRIKNEVENALEAGNDYIKRSKKGEFDVIELDKKLEEINYRFYYEMNERFIKGVERIEGKLDEIPEEYIKEAEVIINSGKENLINFYHDGTKSGE